MSTNAGRFEKLHGGFRGVTTNGMTECDMDFM